MQFNTATTFLSLSYTGTAKTKASLLREWDKMGSDANRLPLAADLNQVLFFIDVNWSSFAVLISETSYRLSSSNLSLKATSLSNIAAFSVCERLLSVKIGIRAIPSKNWKKAVTLPLIISAVSVALSLR